jgi:putative addiction module killer protein
MRTRLTAVYCDWLDSVEDVVTRARIQARVDRLAHGNPGKFRRLSGGICELKMNFGPGYRVYYTERKGELIVLCGGDKSSQERDIQSALALLEHL